MPVYYNCTLATAGNLTTSGTANTEVDAAFVKAGAGATVSLEWIEMIGKATALTAISSIALRGIKLGTASTGGTGITPAPAHPAYAAASCTCASRPTIGSTRVNHIVTGCSAGGKGTWIAPRTGSAMTLAAGGALSMDLVDSAGTVSLTYELSFGISE